MPQRAVTTPQRPFPKRGALRAVSALKPSLTGDFLVRKQRRYTGTPLSMGQGRVPSRHKPFSE